MMADGALDLGTVDARVARANAALERALAELAEPGLTEDRRAELRAVSPFQGALREVARQSMFVGLRERGAGPVHAGSSPRGEHRDALLRWVHELLQARVAWDLALDEADAVHLPDPALASRAAAEGAIARTYDEARRALVEAPDADAADVALRRLDALAPPVVAVRRERLARRFEAARRLGLAHPWALAAHGGAPKLAELARAALDVTEPLAIELRKDVRRRSGGDTAAHLPAHLLDDGFARDAREGWPARLHQRWLEEVFANIAPRPPRTARLPRALGGASFLRAALSWGVALRRSSTARSLPFALAHDPYPTEAYLFGGVLAVTVADRVFARRKLGLPARSADAHARALGRVLFATFRRFAADVVNGTDEPVRPDDVAALGARIFGAPLPPSLGLAWATGGFAGRDRVDAPARLAGALRAHRLVGQLVERFDEDWFDNPRARAYLGGLGAGPAWQGDLPDLAAVGALGRSFEELLG